MPNYYATSESIETRAVQIYPILLAAAAQRSTITYIQLAKLLGFKGAGVFNKMLGCLMHWCADNQLPPLTSLVVNAATGLPGDGLTRLNDLHSDREKVFAFEWYKLVPPTLSELEDARTAREAVKKHKRLKGE